LELPVADKQGLRSSSMSKDPLVPTALIEKRIYLIRRQKVMLDRDLAKLYGVTTAALNQAVRRNADRFPEDFMFQLCTNEFDSLRSQIVTLEGRGKHPKYLPRVFTEQGVAMLSGVLRSKRAGQVNIAIMRTFVQLRRMLETNEVLARKLADLEAKYDDKFRVVFEAIRQLMAPPTADQNRRQIGFPIDDG
jgi:hypothetical protein